METIILLVVIPLIILGIFADWAAFTRRAVDWQQREKRRAFASTEPMPEPSASQHGPEIPSAIPQRKRKLGWKFWLSCVLFYWIWKAALALYSPEPSAPAPTGVPPSAASGSPYGSDDRLAAAASTATSNYATCILDDLPGSANEAFTTAAIQRCLRQYPGGLTAVAMGSGKGFFGFDDAQGCILKKARDTTNQRAGFVIAAACRCLYTSPFYEGEPCAQPR